MEDKTVHLDNATLSQLAKKYPAFEGSPSCSWLQQHVHILSQINPFHAPPSFFLNEILIIVGPVQKNVKLTLLGKQTVELRKQAGVSLYEGKRSQYGLFFEFIPKVGWRYKEKFIYFINIFTVVVRQSIKKFTN